jgi:hypothetical protein
MTRALGPTACDAFAIFEDLCLLGNGERPTRVPPQGLCSRPDRERTYEQSTATGLTHHASSKLVVVDRAPRGRLMRGNVRDGISFWAVEMVSTQSCIYLDKCDGGSWS